MIVQYEPVEHWGKLSALYRSWDRPAPIRDELPDLGWIKPDYGAVFLAQTELAYGLITNLILKRGMSVESQKETAKELLTRAEARAKKINIATILYFSSPLIEPILNHCGYGTVRAQAVCKFLTRRQYGSE